jgi:hypothetical protein
MILIFSTNEDQSTQKVADWLFYYKQQPIIINELNPIVAIFFDIKPSGTDELTITLQSGQTIAEKDIKVVWYRRGLYYFAFPFSGLQRKPSLKPIYQHLKNEYGALSQYFFYRLQHKTIGDYNQSLPNKLIVLEAARKAGLTIPNTRVLSDKKNALGHEHITKSITEIITMPYKGKTIYNRTAKQEAYTDAKFFPSLIQTAIKKQAELRVFFFVDSFFAMAMVAPSGQELLTDNRDITASAYLHRMPFTLPKSLAQKLVALITMLGYTTCSIDLLIDEKGKYHFLELNPVGQFDNLSALCNMQIEKFIAQKLIIYEKRNIAKRGTIDRNRSTLNIPSL